VLHLISNDSMRIKTSKVLRYIDNLKESISRRNVKFLHRFYWLSSFISSSGKGRALILFLIAAFSVLFAAFQFGLLVALGFCTLELLVYRLANAFLRMARI
jgi:hypothetical protein